MNITLIGMPGVGKSVIGKKLAERIGCSFIDTDELIEKNANLKLQEVVDKFGDEKFLKIEEKTILNLGNFNNCLISPGGSAIYSAKAMEFLRKRSVVVFLDDSLENIMSRVRNFSKRGIIGLKKKTLKNLFKERTILYKKYADVSIKIPDNFRADEIARDIINKLFLAANKFL